MSTRGLYTNILSSLFIKSPNVYHLVIGSHFGIFHTIEYYYSTIKMEPTTDTCNMDKYLLC